MSLDILIIDDNESKIDALRKVISPLFAEGELLIEEAHMISDAREQMRLKAYDLIILDMVIPELEGEEALRTGGADFLEEIENNDSVQKPLQIIGLTEFEAEYKELQDEFRNRLWHLLFYSQSHLEWKKQLRDKVLQLYRMKNDFIRGLELRNKYDIGIICALSEEFDNLLEAFDCDWTEIQIPPLPYSFRTTTLTTRGMRDLRIIAACTEYPGVCATTVLATSIYNLAHVEAIFMTGITAGFKNNDILIDDVVVAESVIDYAKGKVIENSDQLGEIGLLHEISQISANHGLISKVSAFCRKQGVIDDINDDVRRRQLKDKRTNITPHVSKTVCGPFVMQSESIMEMLLSDDRKLQALDMEGFGLYFVSHVLGCPMLWMKAVCDYGIDGKDNSRHQACSYISARFLFEFLREEF